MGRVAVVTEIQVQSPPPLAETPDGAETSGQAYTLQMPATADQPVVFISPESREFRSIPRELAFRDSAGQIDYVTGGAPVNLTVDGFGARFRRLFPWDDNAHADDVYLLGAEGVKNIVVLSDLPRAPGEWLNPDVDPGTGIGLECGVSWQISGVPLPVGFYTDMEVWGFRFPRPVVRALDGTECLGRYEVIDTDQGQVMFVWFPYSWFLEHPGPYNMDPSVTTSTSSAATGYSHQWKMLRFSSNGVLVAFLNSVNTSAGSIICRVSTDNGQTWVVPTIGDTIGSYGGVSVTMDDDEYLHLAILRTSPSARIVYARGVPTAARTGFTWTLKDVDSVSEVADYQPAIAKAMPEGTAWVVFLAYGRVNNFDPSNYVLVKKLTIATDGTITVAATGWIIDSLSGTSTNPNATIDSDASKNLWVTAFRTNKVVGRRALYDAGNWTWQTVETIEGGTGVSSGVLSATVDSQGRHVVGFRQTSDNLLTVRRRSATGVYEELSDIPAVTPTSLQIVSIESELWAFFTYAGGLGYLRHDGSTWGPIVSLSTDTTLKHVAVQRNPSALDAINLIATKGSASPYTVESFRIPLNAAPQQPSNLTRSAFDATTSAQFTWKFNDPNPGDSQSAYQLQIVRVSDGAIVYDTGKVSSPTSAHTLPAGTLANGVQYQWRVMTWDQSNLASPWSGYVVLITSAKPVPTLLSPTAGATVGSSEAIVSWSVGDQSKYRVRRYDPAGLNVQDDTGEVSSTSGRSRSMTGLAQSTSYQMSLQVANSAGIWSDEVFSGAFQVQYQPPNPVRNLAAVADAALAAVKVRWKRDWIATAQFTRASVAYLSNGQQVASGVPRYDTVGGVQGVWVEESVTNLFPAANSQTFSGAWTSGTLNGTYTVSIRGATGSLTLSGGATGTVNAGGTLTFTVSNATVTFTPTGSPERCQLEQKASATTWQIGGTARAAETPLLPTTGLSPTQGCWRQWVYVNSNAKRQGGSYTNRVFEITRGGGAANGIILGHFPTSTSWIVTTTNDAGTVATVSFGDSVTPEGWHLFEVKWTTAAVVVFVDGAIATTIPNPTLPTQFGTAYIGRASATTDGYLNTVFGQTQLLSTYPTDQESADAYANGLQWDDNTLALYTWSGTLEGGTQPSIWGGQYEVHRDGVRIDLVDHPAEGDVEYVDHTAAAGVTYSYEVRAMGNNGTQSAPVPQTAQVRFSVPWLIHPTNPAQNLRLPLTQSDWIIQYPQASAEMIPLDGDRKTINRGPVLGAETELVIVVDHRNPRTAGLDTRLLAAKKLATTWLLKTPQQPGSTRPGDVWEVSLGELREVRGPDRTVFTVPVVEVGESRA